MGLLLGGFARSSAIPERVASTAPFLVGRSVTAERLQRAATVDSVTAERIVPDLADNVPLIPSRPAIRRFRSEDRLLEQARAIIARRMAALSARLSSRASAGASAAAVQWRRMPEWRHVPTSQVNWRAALKGRALPTWRRVPTWRNVPNWRNVHWEAVASGVLIGIALTIAPAIYLLTAPHRASLPNSATQAENESSAAVVPPSIAAPSPAITADNTAVPPATLAPPPPAIVPPDPPSLVTSAGGTTNAGTGGATATSGTGSPATASEQVAAVTAKNPATALPPTKTATAKSTSSKKQKPKAGTVTAHQVPNAAMNQLSPAKR